jgi:hypothetical protein
MVARLLIQRRRWQWYPWDLLEHNHLIARADPVLHPNICKALGRSFDESWVHPTPQQLFEQVLATNEERFPMICDDIRLMPQRPPVLVEGPRLFTKLVAPVLTSPLQAIWLLPTEAFIHASQSEGTSRVSGSSRVTRSGSAQTFSRVIVCSQPGLSFCGFRRRGQVTNRVEALQIRARGGEDAALWDKELAEPPLLRQWPRTAEVNTTYHRSTLINEPERARARDVHLPVRHTSRQA